MTTSERSEFALLGDSPIIESGRDDMLKFGATAEVLAKAATDTDDPLTIGIYGDWGSGKTSLMRLIERKLRDSKKVLPVWFNAWQYEREDHLIVPLCATLEGELRAQEKLTKELLGHAKTLVDFIRVVLYPLGKDSFDKAAEIEKKDKPPASLYHEAFKQLKDFAATRKAPRIVVFVDDLDRCFPERAVDLLESIKLVLHLPGFVFILGVNEKIIQACVKTKYSQSFGHKAGQPDEASSPSAASQEVEQLVEKSCVNYLDKIVQVEIPVPRRDTAGMQEYIEELVKQAHVIDEGQVSDAVPLVADAAEHNPRSAVRLLNRMIVTANIWKAEEKQYDPLHLLIHIATDRPRFALLVGALDDPVIRTGDDTRTPVTVGALMSEALSKDQDDTNSLEALRQVKVTSESRQRILDMAIDVLKDNKHLLGLLRSDKGRKWLSDPEIRKTMSESAKQTISEGKRDTAQQQVPEPVQPKAAVSIAQSRIGLVEIKTGKFTMGSDRCGDDAKPHAVKLTKPFLIGEMQVTQAQYESVMGENPSFFKGADLPVENVSWKEAVAFCKKLTAEERKAGRLSKDKEYRLPTEAEWEFCCRAESTTEFCFGDDDKMLGEYAWFGENSDGKTHPVGKKKPNRWGLYDMHGNVWEWCQDWYADYPPKADGEQSDPDGPSKGDARVLRGGSWDFNAQFCRSACRVRDDPGRRIFNFGFRVVVTSRTQ
ncbi:MAG: SUMF1/EgtB/PvdO family nonheme iron enzyme [Candidatus Brocadiia bacterium]